MTITVVLPLPNKHLSPNARCHWHAKARAVKGYRTAAAASAIIAQHGERWLWSSASVRCRFFFKDARSRDSDNLLASMKSAFDGLADAGLVVNDRDLYHLPVKQAKDKENPRVEIDIQRKDGA